MSSCVGAISLDGSAFYFSRMLTRRIISFFYVGFADSSETCCTSIVTMYILCDCDPSNEPRLSITPIPPCQRMVKNAWIHVDVLLITFKIRSCYISQPKWAYGKNDVQYLCVSLNFGLVCNVPAAFTNELDQVPLIKTVVSGLSSWKSRPLSSCRQLKQTLNKLFCIQQV